MLSILSRVAWQSVEDRVVIIDLETGRACGLNETGSAVWTMMETHSPAQIAQQLSSRHSRPMDQVTLDVEGFIAKVRERGWVGDAV